MLETWHRRSFFIGVSFLSLSLHKKQIGQGQTVSGEQDLSNENATKQSGGVTCMKPIMVVTATKSFSLDRERVPSWPRISRNAEADHHCIWHTESIRGIRMTMGRGSFLDIYKYPLGQPAYVCVMK